MNADSASPMVTSHLIDTDIVIGKDILELITAAMYVEPLAVYREYVQNASDALDDALNAGNSVNAVDDILISVSIDPQARSISIKDCGHGIPKRDFVRRLTAIGGSKKRGQKKRGFRGVGRLAGLAYCQQLVFRGRAYGESEVSILRWDVRAMRAVLRDPQFSGALPDAIKASVQFSTEPIKEGESAHFFEVRMEGVVRLKNDVLMDENAVRDYLGQTAPVPFSQEFVLGSAIQKHLAPMAETSTTYRLRVVDKEVFRPHADLVAARGGGTDAALEVEPLIFTGVDGEVSAAGWILHHGYLGALPQSAGVSGLRLRKNNIQVGGNDIAVRMFEESRFNAWVIGEIHVLDPRIVPNGRRDDFESNTHYYHLQSHLAALATRLSKKCREASGLRAKAARHDEPIVSATKSMKAVRKLNSSPTVAIAALKQIEIALKRATKTQPVPAAEKLIGSLEKEIQELSKSRRKVTPADLATAKMLTHAFELFGVDKSIQLLEKFEK